MSGVRFAWRGDAIDAELVALTESSGGTPEAGWWDRIRPHSLGWVVAREEEALLGFVNVPWDGLVHAWIQDTMVAMSARHRGVGKELIAAAARGAREAGCEWLHVDFDDDLREFYFDACGFTPTNAGLIEL